MCQDWDGRRSIPVDRARVLVTVDFVADFVVVLPGRSLDSTRRISLAKPSLGLEMQQQKLFGRSSKWVKTPLMPILSEIT